jgi:hypothetical protein
LRNVGVLASKQELVAIIRRIDLDGDAKVSLEEFGEGIRSQFSLTGPAASKVQPGNPTYQFMSKQQSKADIHQASSSPQKKSRSIMNTPVKSSSSKVSRSSKKRPQSANKALGAQNKQRNNML